MAPATASMSLPTSGFSGNGAGGVVMNVPVNVSSLPNGLSAASIAIAFNTGVFDFPNGGNLATVDVSFGNIPMGGSMNWNLAANAPIDGQLDITLSATVGQPITTSIGPGSLLLVSFPISPNFNPARTMSEPITIPVRNAANSNTQIIAGAGSAYTLSPAPPYSGTVTINPIVEQPPTVAPMQSFTTESNTTLSQAAPGLLTGAKDPQGQVIKVNSISGVPYTPGTALTLPSGASLTVSSDGSFLYVSANDLVGTDTFTFTAVDFGGNVSNVGTVSITIVPTLRLVTEGSTLVLPGQTVTEDLVLDNPDPTGGVGPLTGFNVAITYDPRELSTASDGSQTAPGPDIPADWTFTPNALTPGVVGIGAFGSGSGSDLVPGPAPIVLATVQFTVIGLSMGMMDIDLVPLATGSAGTASTSLVGSGGTFVLEPALPGSLQAVTLTAGGSGYTTPPTLLFSGGGGKDAEATAVLQNNGADPGGDPVIALILTNQGDGYTSAPTVSFITNNGAPGSGAAATATNSTLPPGAFLPGVDTRISMPCCGPVLLTVTSSPTIVRENTNASASGTFMDDGGIVTSLTASEGTVTPSAPGTASGTWAWSEMSPLVDGSHTVTITGADSNGAMGSTEFTFTVTDVQPMVGVTSSPSLAPENTTASASGTFADFDDHVTALTASEGVITPAGLGSSSGSWTWSESPPLSDGLHIVTITATNADGSTSSTSFTFTVSDAKPTVSVTSSPGSLLTTQTASASGTFSDYDDDVTSLTASEGMVTPAAPGTLSGNWTWSEAPPLSMAPHTVTISATNADGSVGSTTFTLLACCPPPPQLRVTGSPTNVPENTNASASGTFSDSVSTVTSLTSSEGTVTPSAPDSSSGTWTWSETAPLTDGAHSVTITLTDLTSFRATTTFTFIVTDVNPTMNVTSSPGLGPENMTASASGTFNDYDDNITALTTSEGAVAAAGLGSHSGSWTWSETPPLTDGPHTVTITGTNPIGSTGTTNFTFIVTDVGPTVTVTSIPPVGNTASASGTFADFDDNVTSVTASEGTVARITPSTSGTWTWSEGPPFGPGVHTVMITAVNADGSVGSTSFTLIFPPPLPPQLTVTSSPSSAVENTNASASGTFSDFVTITSLTASEGTVTPGAPDTSSGSWTWSETAPLLDGPHTVTVTLTDLNDFRATTSFTFMVTDANPTMSVTSSPGTVPKNATASASGTFSDYDDNVTSLTTSEGIITPAGLGNWTWSESPPLSDGSHTVTITATNADGTTGSTTFTFTATDVKPTVAFSSSPPLEVPDSIPASASGTFSDFDDKVTSLTASEGTVTPSAPGTQSGTWTWSETPPLTDGLHTVYITATNADGSTGRTSFSFDALPTVFVDPTFTGAPGTDPSTDPGLGLEVGVNAFATITASLPHIKSGGRLVIFGATYTEPSVDFNIPPNLIELATNPADAQVNPTVTIAGAVTLNTTASFYPTSITTGIGTSSAANLTFDSTVDGPGSLEFFGPTYLTFNAPVGGNTALSELWVDVPSLGTTLGPDANLVRTSGDQNYFTPLILGAVSTTFDVGGSKSLIESLQGGAGNAVVKDGVGTLTLGPAGIVGPADTYSGLTTVNAGFLNLNNPGGAINGDLLINTTGAVVDQRSGEIAATSTVTIAGSGSLTLNAGVSETISKLTSSSSTSSVVVNSGSSLSTGGGGSSTYAGALSDTGTLNKVGPSTSFTLTGNSGGFAGTVNVVGTLTVNGTLSRTLGAITNQPLNLTDPSSVLNGSGNVNMPVVINGTASGASVSGVTITAATTGIDVQAGANNVAISGVTVEGSSHAGILAEPGNGNMLSITASAIGLTGSTKTMNNVGIEAQDGCITATGNNIAGNNVGVEISATATPLLLLEGNSIMGNSAAGLRDENPSMQVTAILNWWGSATGPTAPEVVGVNVDNYTPYATDFTSAGIGATTFDFFNGTGTDGNVYVTPTYSTSSNPLGQNTITATADATNGNLIQVTINGATVNYLRGGVTNRVIIYGFGDNVASTHSTISVSGDSATSPWNAQINSEALEFREPFGFSGPSNTTITISGFGNDVIFGGGNDTIAALTSGDNVIVAGLSTGNTGAPTAPQLSGGSGSNIYIAGDVDCALAPKASTGRLDYEALSAIDNLWAMGMGGMDDAMNAAALFSVVNTPGCILTGTARATILPGSGQSWFVVKGAGNPINTPSGLNADYLAGWTANPNYRQAIQ